MTDRFTFELQVKRYYKVKMRKYIIIMIVAFALLAVVTFIGWYSYTHYIWEEEITSKIVNKEDREYTTREKHGDHYDTVHHDDNKLYLADGHISYVSQSEYDFHFVGDYWTYSEYRVDWKPGMENSPFPVWILCVALTGVLGIMAVITLNNIRKVRIEMYQYDELGDEVIGNA